MTRVIKLVSPILTLALVAALFLIQPVALAQEESGDGEDDGANRSVGEVLDNADQWMNQEITVDGTVSNLQTPNAFTISGDGEQLLVVGEDGTIPNLVEDDASVSVTGTLHTFDAENPEIFGDVSIDPQRNVFDDFRGEPVLVAQNIIATDEAGADSDADPNPAVAAILEAPDGYIGQEVNVQAAIDDLLNPQAFTLNAQDTEQDLLVFGARDVIPGTLEDDMTVQVTGVIHLFNEDFDGSSIGIDAENSAYDDFEGNPVLVATSITPLTDDDGTDDEGDDFDYGVDPGRDDDEENAPPTLTEILRETDAFIGTTVTLSVQVADLLGDEDQALAVTSSDANGNLLVLTAPDSLPGSVTEGALIHVTGTIEAFNPDTAYEFDGDTVEFTDDEFDEYDGEPALLAQSISVVAPELGESIDNIIENTDAYTGQTVNVVGKVSDTLGAQSFTYEGTDGFLGIGGEDLLVVGATDMMPTEGIVDNAIVQVRGTVRLMDDPDDESDDGFTGDEIGIDITEDPFSDFQGDAVIVADSVQVLAAERGETVENIVENTGDYLEQDVTVAGNINEVVSQQAFTLDGTEQLLGLVEENLLVIGPTTVTENAGLSEDSIVVVSGTVQRFDPEDEFQSGDRTFQLDVEGVDDTYSDFEGDAVLVVDRINVVAVN